MVRRLESNQLKTVCQEAVVAQLKVLFRDLPVERLENQEEYQDSRRSGRDFNRSAVE
jgi:hypothetical protein